MGFQRASAWDWVCCQPWWKDIDNFLQPGPPGWLWCFKWCHFPIAEVKMLKILLDWLKKRSQKWQIFPFLKFSQHLFLFCGSIKQRITWRIRLVSLALVRMKTGHSTIQLKSIKMLISIVIILFLDCGTCSLHLSSENRSIVFSITLLKSKWTVNWATVSVGSHYDPD